jgi:aryl-alcohol dehydrogenase-like predicted oxidoreductase
MLYRPLGATGATVSEVSMGCNRLGEGDLPDRHWVDLVRRAVDLGVNLFDTSESYGWGRSEELLGQALGNRAGVLIATKMSRVRDTDAKDFSAARMVLTVEQSLQRLRRDCIDVYQLHSPGRADLERFDWAEGMASLASQGKIRWRAVAVNRADDGIWLIQQGLVDVLQVTYNLFDTSAEAELFPLAQAHGVGILCRLPLAQGILTGKFRAGDAVPAGHRAHLAGSQMADRIAKAETLRPLAADYPGGLTRLAHHFSLTPPAVSAIIPGARTVAQLEENVAAANAIGLPPAIRAQLDTMRASWTTNPPIHQ